MEIINRENRFFPLRIIGKKLLVLFFVAMVIPFAYGTEATPEPGMERQPILFELSLLDDGIYRGSSVMADSEYTVDITVEAHRLKGITVIKGPQRVFTRKCGLCDAKDMIREAIEKQSLPVDAYSGATQTTQAILRAVEEALMTAYDGPDDGSTTSEAWR